MLTKSLALFMGLRAQTVVQRGVTNCPLPALLAAMAHAMPGRLRAMIKMLPVRTPRTSSFFEVPEMARGVPNFTSNVIFSVDFQHNTVEVTPILFVDGKNRPRFAMSTDRGGWVSYIEKAYVVYRCKYVYSNLNFLGGSATPLTVARVVEDVAHAFDWYRLTERELWRDPDPESPDPPPGRENREMFDPHPKLGIKAFPTGVTKTLDQIFKRQHLRATIVTTPHPNNHTLAVIKYDENDKKVTLYDAMRNAPLAPMTLQTFLDSHDAVFQVR